MYRDLGAQDRPLLPTASVWVDPAVRAGRADWQPFRDPGQAPAAAAPGQAEAPDDGGSPAAADHGDVEQRIRAMLADYNRFLGEKQYAELPTFFVESQSKVVEQLTEVLPALFAKMKELNEALPQPDPTLDQVLQKASVKTAMAIEVSGITARSDSEATGTLVPAGEIRFVLADDGYWYIDLPAFAGLGPTASLLSQSTQALDRIISGIKSGQVSPDAVAAQLAPMMQMLQQMAPNEAPPTAAGEAPPDGAADEPGDESTPPVTDGE
jgi:uncharacterized coiled-coil protein SlyX